MKTKVFAVFAALAAVTIAAPQHRQTSLNKVAQSPATIFEDYCYDECWQEIKPCPPPWYPNNKGTTARPCWTCCYPYSSDAIDPSITPSSGNDEIDIIIKISDTSAAKSASALFEDPCWLVCWFEIPQCPDGMYSNNKGTAEDPCWTCCWAPPDKSATPSISSTSEKEEIDIKIQISDTITSKSASSIFEDYCWEVCSDEVPTCPRGWYSNSKGTSAYPCWTCCKAPTKRDAAADYITSTPSEEEIEVNIQISDTTAAVSPSYIFEDPCWRVCWHEVPKCPHHWYSNNKGTAAHPCWTCCRAPDEVDASAPSKEDIEVDVQISNTTPAVPASFISSEICWRICADENLKCPEGWHPKKFDHCWTCCRTYDESTPSGEDMELEMEAEMKTIAASSSSIFEDPCWRVCWHKVPKCPHGWYSNNKGTTSHPCWTCCRAPTDNAAASHWPGLPLDL